MTTVEQIQYRIGIYTEEIDKLRENPLPESVQFITLSDYANRIKELRWVLEVLNNDAE